jgi:hypothetical protein
VSLNFAELSATKGANRWGPQFRRRAKGEQAAIVRIPARRGRSLRDSAQLFPLAYCSAITTSLESRVLEKAAVASFPWGRRQRGFPGIPPGGARVVPETALIRRQALPPRSAAEVQSHPGAIKGSFPGPGARGLCSF